MKTNLELIEDYVAGEDSALEALFFKRGYYDSCFFKARRYVQDITDAHTVAGDTFLSLRAKDSAQRTQIFDRGGRTEAGFRNYMLTVAENKAKDQYAQRIKLNEKIPALPFEPEEAPMLSPDEQQPSELFFERNKSVDECAKKLKEAETLSPKESERKPLDSKFLERWRLVGDYDNEPLREAFDMDDDQIRVTKQRIMRRLRRCIGIQL